MHTYKYQHFPMVCQPSATANNSPLIYSLNQILSFKLANIQLICQCVKLLTTLTTFTICAHVCVFLQVQARVTNKEHENYIQNSKINERNGKNQNK